MLRILAATSVLALFGCASETMGGIDGPELAEAGGDRECFFPEQVNGFSENEDRSFQIQVAADRHYKVTTRGVCQDLYRTQSLGLDNSGIGQICTGENVLGVDIVTPESRCGVKSITRVYTDRQMEEMAEEG